MMIIAEQQKKECPIVIIRGSLGIANPIGPSYSLPRREISSTTTLTLATADKEVGK